MPLRNTSIVSRCEICDSITLVKVRKDLHQSLICDECFKVILETVQELENNDEESEDLARSGILPEHPMG